jgi:DNA repair photolyase
METLSNEGIQTGIAVAPVIPGYNESDIPGLLQRAKDAGATRCFMSMLHIDSDSIEEYFVEKMRERIPARAEKIIKTMKRERGGKLQHNSYAERDMGRTEQWEVTKKLFEFHSKKLGFNQARVDIEVDDNAPSPVPPVQQPRLF